MSTNDRGTCGHALIDLAERYADNPELQPEVAAAFHTAKEQGVFGWAFWIVSDACLPDWEHEEVCSNELDRAMAEAHDRLVDQAGTTASEDEEDDEENEDDWETRSEAVSRHTSGVIVPIIRDVFGNPFRPVTLDPSWLTSDVVALAEGIYQDKAVDRLSILADALQDAGCNNEDVLNHCRSEGPHCRGCWVIDLLTGRK